MSRTFRFWPLLAILVLLLASCGASPAAPASSTAPSTSASIATTSPAVAATATASDAPATDTPAEAASSTLPDSPPLSLTDSAGRTVEIAAVPQQIVSLAPSTTEILFAIGAGPRIVAVDTFSDFPAEAANLPKIGGTNLTYNVEQIVTLKPDLVMAAGITPINTVNQLADLGLTVVVLGSAETSIDNVFADIELTGRITGQRTQAEQVVAGMRQKYEQTSARVAQATSKPRVYWELDATDVTKPYSVGPNNFVNDLITLSGGVNIFAEVDSPYPQVGSEQIVAANPEIILLADAEYGITTESVVSRPGWNVIGAVQQSKIFPIDSDLATRPGPRVIDGLEAVARLIHPEVFQ